MRRKPVEQAEGLRSTFKSPVIAEKSKGLLETSASVSSLIGEAVVAIATGAFSSSACWEAPAFESSTFPAISTKQLKIWSKLTKKMASKFQKCVKTCQQIHLTHWRLNNNIGYEREMHLHNHNSLQQTYRCKLLYKE
jgi:hypothetical protein